MGGGRHSPGAEEGKADQQRVDGCNNGGCAHCSLSTMKEKECFGEKFYKIHLQRTQVIEAAQNRKKEGHVR